MTLSIGLFGGAFDPFHNGHLGVLKAAKAQLDLEKIIIVPTFSAAHKNQAVFGYKSRLAMVRAIADEFDWLEVSDIESTLPKPSYTLHTLNALQSLYPTAKFTLIIGGDAFNSLPTWFSWQKLISLCKIAIFARQDAGQKMESDLEVTWLEGPLSLISSTQIRQRKALGQSVDELVPSAILPFIQ